MLSAIGLLTLALLQPPAAATPRLDTARTWADLVHIVGLGPRPSGSPALDATRTYLSDQLTAIGVTPVRQSWTAATPAGPIPMVNLRAVLPGEVPERIVLAGHYDTKRFTGVPFVGANDGGSSAALLLGLARALQGQRHHYTIELLFLDGEESTGEWEGTDHTYGSRYYVGQARADGTLASLAAVVLVDMIGDRDLRISREINSTRWLTDIVWRAADAAGYGETFVADTTAIEDDHLEFLEAGIPAVDLIDLDYPEWHTPQDTLAALSARSLQTVGTTVLAALPLIEQHLRATR